METLPRERCLDLLAKARPEINKDAAQRALADQICDQLGDLPLALSVTAAYLKKYKREPLQEYLDALRQKPAIEDASLQPVWASFERSYEKLKPSNKTDALAMQLFHFASHFAPASISRELLARAAGLDTSKRNDRRAVDDALARLRDLGLLTEEPDGRILLHRLLREFARLHPAPQMTAEQAAEAVGNALLQFARRENMTGLPRRLRPELMHLREALADAETRASNLAGSLHVNLGYYADMVALYKEAKEHCEKAVSIGETEFGEDHPEVALRVNNLAGVLRALGDLAGAKAAYERALKIDEAAFGPDHPKVAIRLNNLGGVLRALGDLAGAKAAYERALQISEVALGPDHPNVATCVNNLGLVLKDFGDLAGAKAAFERALQISEVALGPDHPTVAIRVNNLGFVLKDFGDLAGAKVAFERALKIDEVAFGPDHPSVARDVNNLGLVLRDLGDLAGAKAAHERALKIDEAAFGPDHAEVAVDVNNLAGVLRKLGDLAGAKAAYERALKILRKSLGDAHPRTQQAKRNLEALSS